MKAFLFTAALAASMMATGAKAATTAEILTQAKQAFSERDYNPAGIQRAQVAADLYGQLVTQASNNTEKAEYLAAQSEALYFVGNATEDNKVKIDKHLLGMQVADQAVQIFGITDVTKVSEEQIEELQSSLSEEELALLAEALYQRGANLGQWGSANGVMQSLSKWPELRSNMEVIIDLGHEAMHEYAPNRVLGRGYFKIPGLLGGSTKKADKYLSEATNNTLAAGQIYSVNGHNNVYYAEVLKENGEVQKAKDLLNAFLKADASTLNPKSVPETKQAQKDAAALLAAW